MDWPRPTNQGLGLQQVGDCNRVTPRYYNHHEWELLNVNPEMILKVSLFVPSLSSASEILAASQQSATITEASSSHLLIEDRSRGIFSVTADSFAIFPWLILSVSCERDEVIEIQRTGSLDPN